MAGCLVQDEAVCVGVRLVTVQHSHSLDLLHRLIMVGPDFVSRENEDTIGNQFIHEIKKCKNDMKEALPEETIFQASSTDTRIH